MICGVFAYIVVAVCGTVGRCEEVDCHVGQGKGTRVLQKPAGGDGVT